MASHRGGGYDGQNGIQTTVVQEQSVFSSVTSGNLISVVFICAITVQTTIRTASPTSLATSITTHVRSASFVQVLRINARVALAIWSGGSLASEGIVYGARPANQWLKISGTQ